MRATLDDALEVVAPIVADVRERGDAALLEWTERFDGPRPDGLRVTRRRDRRRRGRGRRPRSAPADDRGGPRVQRGAAAGGHVASRRRRASSRSAAGSRSTRSASACRAAASPLPSSLVMTAVPARVAGVRRIAVVTPTPAAATLVAARELGIDEVYAVGGAQAVAALAYGTATIAAVDAIVGPGSRYVTAAKLLVSSRVRIDLPAGPSEVVVIADAIGRRPDGVAADLACAGGARRRQRRAAAHRRPTSSPTRWRGSSRATRTFASSGSRPSTRRSTRSEAYAPEHLELHVADPAPLLARIRNAGSVFVGCSSVVGDYAAGRDPRAADRRARAVDGRARDRGVPQAAAGRHRNRRRRAPGRRDRRPARAGGGSPAPRGGGGGVSGAQGEGAARRRRVRAVRAGRRPSPRSPRATALPPEAVLKFDQNTPPLPGVPQIPLAQSMALLCNYPDGTYRELCEAAAAYTGDDARERRRRSRCGRPHPPARAGVPRPGRAGRDRPADLSRSTGSRRRSAEPSVVGPDDDGRPPLGLQPEQPARVVGRAGGDRRACASERPTRSSSSTRRTSSSAPARARRGSTSSRTSSSLRTMSKAFGFASLRVGYALAHPETAALLTERRAPAPIAGPGRRDRGGRAARAAPRRRRGDDRRARAGARGARRAPATTAPRPRRTSSSSGRTSRSAERARGAGDRRALVSGGDPRHGPPAVRERRAAPRARRRARRRAPGARRR